MKIQSLSVVVPTKRCINDCAFCVSKMHFEDYTNVVQNYITDGQPNWNAAHYAKRLEFARDNGCNTVILTGTGEPQQNMEFLKFFGAINCALEKPFRKIEIQTTGVGISKEDLLFFYNDVGITTVSISVSSFISDTNGRYNGTHPKAQVHLTEFCKQIKEIGMNVRLSCNLTDAFDGYKDNPKNFFLACKEFFDADQITLRVLYSNDKDSPQAQWIKEHGALPETAYALKQYIIHHGRQLEKMDYGYIKYSVLGMGIVLDDDCMSTEVKDSYKYLILRPDCKLYSKWDDKGSLIF